MTISIGTAGWSIPRQNAGDFPLSGTALERYSARFAVAEINSSFHRPHRGSTWERWRDSVPDDFRFSVKLPKQITHQQKLVECTEMLGAFLEQASALGEKLQVLLVQLPPKLSFDPKIAGAFFTELRGLTRVDIACEPRHQSWFSDEAETLLRSFAIARVAADPAICEAAASPGAWAGLAYFRLHGSPVMYRSSYQDRIADFAKRLQQSARDDRRVWCIFDNTASSAAMSDAIALDRMTATR